jgi:transcriptional regulator with XRE-family HTH domain
MRTHFSKAIMEAITRNNTTQTAVALNAGITHPALSRLISEGFRPIPETLRGMCAAFPRSDGARVLCGHLFDEIERAGFLHKEIDVQPRADGSAFKPDEIERNADRLAIVARKRKDVRELLAALAIVCEALDETDAPLLLHERVAEIPDAANAYRPVTKKTPKKQRENGYFAGSKNN